MATYTNREGDKIVTIGSRYSLFLMKNGNLVQSRTVDVSKWIADAEEWIDNEIESGYYHGFVKQTL